MHGEISYLKWRPGADFTAGATSAGSWRAGRGQGWPCRPEEPHIPLWLRGARPGPRAAAREGCCHALSKKLFLKADHFQSTILLILTSDRTEEFLHLPRPAFCNWPVYSFQHRQPWTRASSPFKEPQMNTT